MKRFVIAALVENKYGVLTRVSGLFMRRGFNIDSLTVGETDNPALSRITVTVKGDDYLSGQIVSQLKKLHNVKQVEILDEEQKVERELMLVKVRNTPDNRSEILAAAAIYRAKVIDYNPDSLCVEVTGEPSKVNAFINVMRPLGIIELCRTGVVALERGTALTDVEVVIAD